MYKNRTTVKAVMSGTGPSTKLVNNKFTGRAITFHCSISDEILVSYCFSDNKHTPVMYIVVNKEQKGLYGTQDKISSDKIKWPVLLVRLPHKP
jgi:regulator of RNase E activity RraA